MTHAKKPTVTCITAVNHNIYIYAGLLTLQMVARFNVVSSLEKATVCFPMGSAADKWGTIQVDLSREEESEQFSDAGLDFRSGRPLLV